MTSVIASRDFGSIFAGVGETGDRVRVRSYEPVWPSPGEVYDVEGTSTTYRDRWGKNHLQIDQARLVRVRTSGRLLGPWLRQLPGVGETRAHRLMRAFGQDLLDVLDDPARLPDVARALEPERSALATRLSASVQAAFREYAARERDGISEAAFYQQLEGLGVEERSAARSLWRLLGNRAWERLSQRPYCAASVLPWAHADHLGQRLLSAAEGRKDVLRHPDRLAGAVDSVVRDILRTGSTAATRDDLLARLGRKRVPAGEALQIGLERRRVVQGRGILHAPGAAYLERDLHAHLQRLRSASPGWSMAREDRLRAAVNNAECETGLDLTDEQRLAICVLLQQPVALLQGGAGTGKTTSMRVLVAAWERLGGRVEAAALAGKAALKLRLSTGLNVMTIARLLKRLETSEDFGVHRPHGGGVTRGDDNQNSRLPEFTGDTLLLLDEASMVDLPNLRRLLLKMPTGASLLLVGDVAQLPPVGLGQVFHDLVHSGVGLVELTRVLRQAGGNPLLEVAAEIRAGRSPDLPCYKGAEAGVQIAECRVEEVPARLGAVRRELSADGSEVLTLAALQNTVRAVCFGEMSRRQEEGAAGVRIGPLCAWAAVGDPVIMTTNHYRFGLANGQLGRVTSLEPLKIAWEGEDWDQEVLGEYAVDIASAWSITGHKSQGSEAARVVIGLDSKAMLTRQWLYTAVTRARHQAVLVGPRELAAEAVARLAQRTTGFTGLLGEATGSVSCKERRSGDIAQPSEMSEKAIAH
ncbi:ATP-dependent RecD-like DNA helicase [Roseomonas sp. KE2513]|uniref:ATP-dependent DNA helicase n=1 Tax=Roseomonas sp. KE2513 TaxID=2479202 RepID=UPI0018DF66FC|nr:AAA family ATPase [Roseomonas sp. KE2513]